MQDPNFLNPLLNPIFTDVLLRTAVVYLAGLFLILILNKFKVANLWQTNIGKRYLSWLAIGPVFLLFVLFGGYAALFFLLAVLLLSVWEVKSISDLPKSYIIGLIAMSVLSVYVASFQPDYFLSLPLIYFLIITFISFKENRAEGSFANASITLFISIWVIFSMSHFVLLGHLNNTLDDSKALLILLGFAIPLSDICAYVVGRYFSRFPTLDKYKVASNLSSKKSYAGALGNIIGAGIGIACMYFAIGGYLPIYHWVLIAILIGVAGIVGDITESMFKRYYRTKDSGTIIPGHGGVLDRIDSSMRVIVILYYYLIFVL